MTSAVWMTKLLGFKPLLLCSFALAVASFAVPISILTLAYRANADMAWAFQFEAGFGVAWLIVVVIGLLRYRASGLWMLLGSPLVFWPVTAGLVFFRGC